MVSRALREAEQLDSPHAALFLLRQAGPAERPSDLLAFAKGRPPGLDGRASKAI